MGENDEKGGRGGRAGRERETDDRLTPTVTVVSTVHQQPAPHPSPWEGPSRLLKDVLYITVEGANPYRH